MRWATGADIGELHKVAFRGSHAGYHLDQIALLRNLQTYRDYTLMDV